MLKSTNLIIFSLVLTQQGKVVELLCNIRMIFTKHLHHKYVTTHSNMHTYKGLVV